MEVSAGALLLPRGLFRARVQIAPFVRAGSTLWRGVRLGTILLVGMLCGIAPASAQSTFQISRVTPASVLAGTAGVTLTLTGTLPTPQNQTSYAGCFYTGYGNTAGIALDTSTVPGSVVLTVPASPIQTIPPANFTAANSFSVRAQMYLVAAGQVCDGTVDSTLSNVYRFPIVAPALSAYAGPTSVPQTNSAAPVQAAPTSITLSGSGFASGTTVTFGSFGGVAATVLTPTTLRVPVPSTFASSAVGTTASLSVCNGPGTSAVCSTPATPITLTVVALSASTGTIASSPSPATTSGQTTLSARFAKSTASGQTQPGAPSGPVAFTAGSSTLPSARLVLDRTATFATQTTSVSAPVAPTPLISPAAGSFVNSATIFITETAPGASIFYTLDGSTPTSASTPYTGQFRITSSLTVKAVAVVPGLLNSAVASAAYTITISPPTQLAFLVQPVNTATATAIAPAVQVALEDAAGDVVVTSTAAVTISLSTNPGNSTLAGTLTVNAVNGVATFPDLSVLAIANGYSLFASSGNLAGATSNTFNITPYPITLTVQNALVGIASTLNGSFTLGHPAPAAGLLVTLASSTPANVTIAPATVTVPSGQTMGTFTYTGVAAGASTLSASAPNYQTATASVTGTSAQVSLGTIPPVAPGQMVSLALSLAMPAPPGGTTVTFTSSNTSVATVTGSVFVPAGQRTGTVNPQITGIIIGTTTITANAPGYAPDSRAVNVTVIATFNPTTTNQNLTPSTNTTLNISAPAQAGGITFTLTSDSPAIATVPASVTIPQGSTRVSISIIGVSSGTTTIRADSAGVTEATGTLVITSNITVNAVRTGVKLQAPLGIYLPVAPSAPTTVTVTSSNPAIATIALNASTVGSTSVTLPNTTTSYVGQISIQGQAQGTATITVSAPGYTTGTGTVTVDPSGFVFYYYDGDFSTTTYSGTSAINLYTAAFDPATGSESAFELALNPGIADVAVPLTSSSTTVGTITTSPVIFHAGNYYASTAFQPSTAGTTTLTIGTPPTPFTAGTVYQKRVATVTTPAINASNVNTGLNLQQPLGIYLPQTPPAPVDVTVTSNGPRLAVISTDATVLGGTTAVFHNVTSTSVGTVYVQGLATGTTTLTISASSGYTSGTSTLSVYPSGFVYYYYQGNISTTTISQPTSFSVYTAILDPNTLSLNNISMQVRPGISGINVPLTSSNPRVGTIGTSPLVFKAGDSYQTTTFQPVGAGTTTLAIGTPAGYSTPSNYTSLTATVTVPDRTISVNPVTTGVNLLSSAGISLTTAPSASSPLTVTVTSSNPAVATLSKDTGTVGTTSVTYTNVTSTYVGTVYVQGQTQGSTTLTASATGYTSGSSTVTVDPSGFIVYPYQGNIDTTTFSGPTGVTFVTATLNPSNLSLYTYGQQLNPGAAPVNLAVTSSAPSVGTISTSPLVFSPGDTSHSTNFQPVSAGTSTLSIATPSGFSTPSVYQSLSATVSAPVISVGNVETGLNLQNRLYISLPVAPPNAVTVTVKSNGPAIAAISSDGTVVGGTTLTFPNVTSTFVANLYVQGVSLGATTITVSAPGYTNGDGTVTVDPSGFDFFYYQTSFTTSATSSPTSLTVYPTSLTPGTLTVINVGLQLNPGLGTVSVPVTSSNPSVGTITTSPVVFGPGDARKTTSFQPVASGTSTLTIQPPAGFSTPSQYTQSTATVQ